MRPLLISSEIAANGWPSTTFGGVLEHERAQHVRDRLEPRLIGLEPLGVARGELRDLLARAPPPTLR
jgi:hypothetical protein